MWSCSPKREGDWSGQKKNLKNNDWKVHKFGERQIQEAQQIPIWMSPKSTSPLLTLPGAS